LISSFQFDFFISLLKKNCRIILIVPLLLLAACDNDINPVVPGRVQNIPGFFRLTADAEGSNEGLEVDCRLNWIFEMKGETFRTPQLVDYNGIHGGEAFRRILQNDQSGFIFNADVFGEVEARLITHSGEVEFAIPINRTAEGRFWRELAEFEGVMNENGTGNGTWTCAPLDINQGGYVDETLTVEGTWHIEPLPQSYSRKQ
jgi:hypothetical protein